MPLPPEMVVLLAAFAPLFSDRVWAYAQILAIGAILATGKRTVTSALRIMGLSHEDHFTNYHRVLNRACLVPVRRQSHPARPDRPDPRPGGLAHRPGGRRHR